MLLNKLFKTTALLLISLILFTPISFGGNGMVFPVLHIQDLETDTTQSVLTAFFDLRDRETFIQITNTSSSNTLIHFRIFNAGQDCNENDFFDTYTGNDTHVYNIRDIITNDGNPSGVDLPDDAYGYIVAFTVRNIDDSFSAARVLTGNLRILDNNGYEYRTNLVYFASFLQSADSFVPPSPPYIFNFNKKEGVTLSDIVIVNYPSESQGDVSFDASGITNSWFLFDVDIIDNNETLFSCRDVVSACVDEDNPRLEELLALSGGSVASFEYGINNAIPHSKSGELLCPGNIIDEGIVSLVVETSAFGVNPNYSQLVFGFIGLNNGNGRGSMDTWWSTEFFDIIE